MDKISPCFCFLLLTLHLLNTPGNALPFRGLLFDRYPLVVCPQPNLGHYTSQAWLMGAADLLVLTIRYNSADTEKAQCNAVPCTSHRTHSLNILPHLTFKRSCSHIPITRNYSVSTYQSHWNTSVQQLHSRAENKTKNPIITLHVDHLCFSRNINERACDAE